MEIEVVNDKIGNDIQYMIDLRKDFEKMLIKYSMIPKHMLIPKDTQFTNLIKR